MWVARHKIYFQPDARLQIIAFLDTGAGKTLISVLLIRHVAPQLRKRAQVATPAESDGGCARARVLAPRAQRKSRLAFFMAPTVSLVKQVALRTVRTLASLLRRTSETVDARSAAVPAFPASVSAQ